MKRLNVGFAKDILYEDRIESVSLFLDRLEKHPLNFTPWLSYPLKPEVYFSIAHTNDTILLKYYVREKSIRAMINTINGNVWEDSCVEFFISFDDSGYYNFEFNCIGTALVGFGKEKSERELLTVENISKIKYQANIFNIPDDCNNIKWELTLVIPGSTFTYHKLNAFILKGARANFYKCGDGLQEPHFVTWANIISKEPNFHLPEFFGSLEFT